MTKLYKLQLLSEYVTFHELTGQFLDKNGNDRKRKNTNGYWYVRIRIYNRTIEVLAHHFLHYLAFGLVKDKIPFLTDKDKITVKNCSFGIGTLKPKQFKSILELKDPNEKPEIFKKPRKTKPVFKEKTLRFYILEKDRYILEIFLNSNNIIHAQSKKLLSEKINKKQESDTRLIPAFDATLVRPLFHEFHSGPIV